MIKPGRHIKFPSTEQSRSIALWLLLPSISLISHTYLPIPPVVLFFIAALPLFLYCVDPTLNKEPLKISRNVQRDLLPIGLYIVYIMLGQYVLQIPIRSFWGVLNASLYFPIIYLLWAGGNNREKETQIKYFLWIALGVYILEAIIRYSVSWHGIQEGTNILQGIYRFKLGGPVCSDSNSTGIHIIIMFFFSLWWVKKTKNYKIAYILMLCIWTILLGLTLSRACWIAAIIGFLFFLIPVRRFKGVLIIAGSVFVLSTILFIVFLYPTLKYDMSFISKFDIFRSFLEYAPQITCTEWLFGIGFFRSPAVMGIYAHNYLLVFLVESGVVGLLLMLLFFVHTIIKSRGEALYILLPFMIVSMSATILFLPDLFAVLAIICAITNSGKTTEIKVHLGY